MHDPSASARPRGLIEPSPAVAAGDTDADLYLPPLPAHAEEPPARQPLTFLTALLRALSAWPA